MYEPPIKPVKTTELSEHQSHESEGSAPGRGIELMRSLSHVDGFDAQQALLAPHPGINPVQFREGSGTEGIDIHELALKGTEGPGAALPHLDAIQKSFGRHDISHIQAYQGDAARAAAKGMGAEAYATGDRVAFSRAPSLHTAAHEAAHIVQQQGGVSLSGGIGQVGDRYEQHADQVADLVVKGESAESLLNEMSGDGGGTQGSTQLKVQLLSDDDAQESGLRGGPQPKTNDAGEATMVHATPTLSDTGPPPAAPDAPGASSEAHNVKVLAGKDNVLDIGLQAPAEEQLYEVSPEMVTPAPAGFTAILGTEGTIAAPKIEQVMTDSLYINDTPTSDDIQQSGIGDCWFLATLMSITQRDPGKIKSMIIPDGQGGATFTFWSRKMVPGRFFWSSDLRQYSQVRVHVNGELPYRLSTPVGAGNRVPNGTGGYKLVGARLHSAPDPSGAKWWGEIASDTLSVNRRDEYDTAMWAPLLEKALAFYTESYGKYGGSRNEEAAAGSGYSGLNSGIAYAAMFVFYGEAADEQGHNSGGAQRQQIEWAPGSDSIAANTHIIDQLLLLQGRGENAGGRDAPIVTASAFVHRLIPRLKASILASVADADWNNLNADEKTRVLGVLGAIAVYEGLPDDPPNVKGPKFRARREIGTQCATAISVNNAPNLLDTGARSERLQELAELILDLKNIGVDNSPGQRNIYGDHSYSVVSVNIAQSDGTPVSSPPSPGLARMYWYSTIDAKQSNVRLRNPHLRNAPNPTGDAGMESTTGIFDMALNRFFMNFNATDTGVFPRT